VPAWCSTRRQVRPSVKIVLPATSRLSAVHVNSVLLAHFPPQAHVAVLFVLAAITRVAPRPLLAQDVEVGR